MKKIVLRLLVAGLVSAIFFTACQSASDKSTAVRKENIADTKADLSYSLNDSLAGELSDSLTLWQQFKKESTEKINDNKMRIAALKASIAGKAEDVKADYQKSINDLEEKNDRLKRKLAEYKNDKKEDLEAFKQKMNNDINDIGKSLKNFKIK
jgi:hypothetical protein